MEKYCIFLTFKANEQHLNLNGMSRNFIFPIFTSNYTTKKKRYEIREIEGQKDHPSVCIGSFVYNMYL